MSSFWTKRFRTCGKLLKSLLRNGYKTSRIYRTNVSSTHSSFSKVTCGVPQGSILGPLLLLIYVNDTSAVVNNKLLLYADDSVILVTGKDRLQIEKELSKELQSVSEWLVDNKLSLHLGKTESILFGSKIRLKKGSSLNISIYLVMVQTLSIPLQSNILEPC